MISIRERTLERGGNEENERGNNSYGLTTMRNRIVAVNGTKVRFKFRGKSGVEHSVQIADRRLSRIVKKVQDLPGQELFGYLDAEGEVGQIKSQDVNDYLQEITGENFTAKDFRTWAGTVLAAVALDAVEPSKTKKETKANVKNANAPVGKMWGNTPPVGRKC